MNNKEALRSFITTELIMNGNGTLHDDDELLLSGLIDSLGVVRLVTFIEQDLNISVPPEDVTLENFQTLAAIVGYLHQRHVA